jgi:tetratricopeptide (TPR) repeat protein
MPPIHASFGADHERDHGRVARACVRLLREKGDLDAAVDCFQRAIDIDPDYTLAHADLGAALIPVDRQRALRHLGRAIELDPEDYWSRLFLGNLLWMLKRLRQARIQYEAAARLRPDDGFVLAASADFLSVQSGGSPRIEPRFRRAVELAPEEPFVRLCYGQHLLRASRYGDARRELVLADRLGHTRAHLLLVDLGDQDWRSLIRKYTAVSFRHPHRRSSRCRFDCRCRSY